MPTFPTNATFTPRLQLPRPGLDDPADGPDGFNDLTDVLDPIIAGYASGTTAARPAGYTGQFYWNTDTKTLEFYNGTAWGSASGTGAVTSNLPVLDVGMVGQVRAGRQLAVTDFTSLGLAQPVGLWNLSGLTNLGSDGRALANKGAVPFGVGINGVAATSAVFAGSASQALYITDSGAADPFRIKTGSWGCWFRTAKRGVSQGCVSKYSAAVRNFTLGTQGTNNVTVDIGTAGDGTASAAATGVSDIADDRWHFAVATFDGTALRLYVDGVLEATANGAGAINSGAGPLNVGGFAADASTVTLAPHYGRVDEAFVTADVLTDDQVRCLYAAKLTHTLGVVPTDVRLNVHRRRKGVALAVTDFTTTPLRLHNFTAASLSDEGSNGLALTNNGAAVSVAGADGTPGNAFSFAGAQSLSASDAGLPAGTATRSYGCWFKTTPTVSVVIGWGITTVALLQINGAFGLSAWSGADQITGPFVADGQWHLAVAVEDNAAGDGVRRKLFVDGRVVGGSTVLNSVTLGGANRFRIGANPDSTSPFVGQIDGAFVTGYALGADEIRALYAKGSQDMGASPKNAGDHVERVDASSVLFIGDTLESQSTVDVGVVA